MLSIEELKFEKRSINEMLSATFVKSSEERVEANEVAIITMKFTTIVRIAATTLLSVSEEINIPIEIIAAPKSITPKRQ
jgi:hypothetical protein